MFKPDPTNPHEINSTKSLIAIVYLAVIGPAVFILQPGFVQGLIAHVGYSETQSANIVGTEMLALALATIILNVILHNFNWRLLTLIFVILAALGNLISVFVLDNENALKLARFICGFGSGGIISITFTMMGLSRQPDRNFGFIIASVLTYGSFGILAMPWLYTTIGFNGVLVLFTLFCASGAAFIFCLPHGSNHLHDPAGLHSRLPKSMGVLLLASVLLYNIGIGLVWVFLFQVGVNAGMSDQDAANALTVSQFLGIAGAFFAVLVQQRICRTYPLVIGTLLMAVGIYLVVGDITPLYYWAGVCIFNYLWNLTMPYILAVLSEYDKKGSFVAYGVSMQMIGYAAGPFIAGVIYTTHGFDGVNLTAIILFAIAAVIFIPTARAVSSVKKN